MNAALKLAHHDESEGPRGFPTIPPDAEVYVEHGIIYAEVDGELIRIGLEEEGTFLQSQTEDGQTIYRWKPSETRFVPDTRDKVDWVLAQILDRETDALSVLTKLETITRNLQRVRSKLLGDADWLRTRYHVDIERVARDELAKSKKPGKTLVLTHGTISFRNSSGTNAVKDMDSALEWMEQYAPDLIKVTRSVTATNARTAIDNAKREGKIAVDPRWIDSTGPRESMTIEALPKKNAKP